ncbi:4-methylaminobutanoate oxidase (formaldehyde-forming) [Bosea sp. BE271]|nr:4-methylaminobutanoate oxidase (formaldehyde-forming) [Bosea robiniae]MDR6894644.1 4-methylaminobutanoate oxidase (formaldehyde-forming) [Bosea sp. BE109]MDR7137768.1 4-methylaminobutanoate oxidase (formaldehyde-forming) [Bosea sp. BE168]MDR7174467.1 4-methylaminobutanoate oxidase (formaldehyde-forming) [Bosea sp. BE271]
MTKLALRAVEKIERFTDETGETIEFFQPGSMSVARLPEHAQMIQERIAQAKSIGVDADIISPEEAHELNPFLMTKGVLAVSHMRKDLFLEPVQVPRGYANGAKRLGAVLYPNTEVSEIVVENGAVERVVTDRGDFSAKTVVDAAGGWLRLVASFAGSRVPVVAMRHQLMITAPIAGVNTSQPITRILDANVYVRPDKGGLMFGGYETDPKPIDAAKMPPSFRIEDLELDLSVLKRLTLLVKDQLPIFQQDLPLQEHRGGLPTMTIDGDHILGEAPGAKGLFILGGCNVGGLSISPSLGEELAKLIVTGGTTHDLSRMSPARFAADLSEAELLEKCRDRYALYYTYRFKDQLAAAA